MANSRKLISTDHIVRSAESFLGALLTSGKCVTVAYSGGLDSSVLLDVLHTLHGKFAFKLRALHFHHGLSVHADSWTEHCQHVCASLGIDLQVEYLTIPRDTGEGLESAARDRRYTLLDKLETDWVALGHHANDQVETLLLNLIRGAGVLGMAAMQPIRGRYLRPLLALGRNQLLEYARQRKLVWCEDESNQELRFTRNFVRHEIVARLAARIPNVEQKISASVAHAATANQLLIDLAKIDSGGAKLGFPFPVAPFKQLNFERAVNLLRSLLLTTGLQCPPSVRLREFVRQLHDARPDRHPELRVGDVRIKYQRGHLDISSMESKVSTEGCQ